MTKLLKNTQIPQYGKTAVISRFSINKVIVADFALFAIIDNDMNKVVCHLVYDNGEEYCDEMANKLVTALNAL
jgi:hypothetical protein